MGYMKPVMDANENETGGGEDGVCDVYSKEGIGTIGEWSGSFELDVRPFRSQTSGSTVGNIRVELDER